MLENAMTDLPLPKRWSSRVTSAVVAIGALARLAMGAAISEALNSKLERVRLRAECEGLRREVALLKEELKIKDARIEQLRPHERPRYSAVERLAILALRAARGWSARQTARVFLLTAPTIAEWSRRLEERGEGALVQVSEPVNRFPDFVRLVVHQLKSSAPMLGKVRIAQTLARAGLSISSSTVGRILKRPPPLRPEAAAKHRATASKSTRKVTARRPHHVWHIDLTVSPTVGGFWLPWLPFAIAPRWPFAFWIGVVLDHFTREVVAWRLFLKSPSAADVCRLLSSAQSKAGCAPKYVVSDRGAQFQDEYRGWCQRQGVRPRYGAVGQHGSIAIVERFIRSMKGECLRRAHLCLSVGAIEAELTAYMTWYHEHRPHQGLAGRTPSEQRRSVRPVKKQKPKRRKKRLRPIELRLRFVDGRRHLPIVALRRAA